jgi:hypothetical protein
VKHWWKRLLCKVQVHSRFVGYELLTHYGYSDWCRCRWCGMEGLVDGQGNLFRSVSKKEDRRKWR